MVQTVSRKMGGCRECLVFKSEDNTHVSFAFPAGEEENVRKALEELKAYSEKKGYPFTMYNVTPDNFELLEKWYPGRFQIEYERDNADYVYESEKLAALPGKKLHGKRNHVNKFKSIYANRWSYESISRENVEECFQMALGGVMIMDATKIWKKMRDVRDTERPPAV